MPAVTGRGADPLPELLAELLGPTLPARAACAGHAPEHDDMLDGEHPDEREARHHRAAARCRSCPALDPCHAAAADLPGSVGGVWAGVVRRPGRGGANVERPGPSP